MLLEQLLSLGLRQTTDDAGTTLLMHASGTGQVSVVRYLLAFNDDDINARDKDGDNALFYGVRSGKRDVLGLLVAAGVETVCNVRRVCVLALCLANDDDELVDIIVAGAADLAAAASGTDSQGRSTLQVSRRSRLLRVSP